MATVSLTPKAESILRRQVQTYGVPEPGVVIYRLGKSAEVTRGSDGKVLWAVEYPGATWGIKILALDSLPVRRLDVNGIAFGLLQSDMPDVQLCVLGSQLHVREIGT